MNDYFIATFNFYLLSFHSALSAASLESSTMLATFNEDFIILCCSFLPPSDLASLALTCKHFGAKPSNNHINIREASSACNANGKKSRKRRSGDGSVSIRRQHRRWSLINEAARQKIKPQYQTKWKDVLSRRRGESWLTVDHRLHQLINTPLVFDQFIGTGLEYVHNDVTYIRAKEKENGSTLATAICQKNIMKSGKHRVQFTAIFPEQIGSSGLALKVGIIRPIIHQEGYWLQKNGRLQRFDPTGRETCQVYLDYCKEQYRNKGRYRNLVDDKEDDSHCSFVDVKDGSHHNCLHYTTAPDNYDTTFAFGNGARLNFLLDLDEGTLSLYKGRQRMEVLQRGLCGEYCWAVTIEYESMRLFINGSHCQFEYAVRIEPWNET